MVARSRKSGELLSAARRGSPGAVEQLLEMFRDYLRLTARAWITLELRGKADPSDLVQETIIVAHRNFHSFRGQTEAELAAWLRKSLAQNLVTLVRRYRSSGRLLAREQSLESLLDQSSRIMDGFLAANGSSPSRQLCERDAGVVLTEALANLSDDHREVIVLRNLEQLAWNEIARRMERSVDAARMLWARALKQLRPFLESRE
jgi:RNA polymerase sigma-70 factor, ECF subfamily